MANTTGRAGARLAWAMAIGAASALEGCATPTLTADGQLVFTPGAERGAVVLTANGVEIVDRTDLPRPQTRSSPYEPYRAPSGLLLPRDGQLRHVAQPIRVEEGSLAIELRPGDAVLPSWGGELLLGLDALASGPTRAPVRLALVIDGEAADVADLACSALASLGDGDTVTLIDSRGPAVLSPLVSSRNHSLLEGAIRRRRGGAARDLPAAMSLARRLVAGGEGGATALVLTDGEGGREAAEAVRAQARALESSGVRVAAAGPAGRVGEAELAPFETDPERRGTFARRRDAIAEALPQRPAPAVKGLELSLRSSPAPSRLIEGSGATSASVLDEEQIFLGDLGEGQGRREVLRVSLPPFVPGEPFRLEVRARWVDGATGEGREASRTLAFRYSDAPDEIARLRAADVLGYASALSLVGKLDRGMLGGAADRPESLRALLELETRSLRALSAERGDGALGREAELIEALRWAEGG